ncbi:MAG: cytochrome c, partial [Gammaproteobacteria bacterium]|nr:cytochrome c [Gammaproteobacteria bacterium]
MKTTSQRSAWRKPIWFSATAAGIMLAISGFAGTAAAADMEAGKKSYERNCAACHRPDGSGMRGAFPPLANNPNLKAEPERVVDSILKGVSGPLEVGGITYNAVMPAMAHLDDTEIANISNYVLNSWGNSGPEITAAQVKTVREGGGLTDRA